MEPMMFTALGTIGAALIGFSGVCLTYWMTKSKEREAELRKEKVVYYKEFLTSLAGRASNDQLPPPTADAILRYETSYNVIGLFGSVRVIKIAQKMQKYLNSGPSGSNLDEHNKLLIDLVSAIRIDLGMQGGEQKIDDLYFIASDAGRRG